MKIETRSGILEEIDFNKVKKRLVNLVTLVDDASFIDPDKLAKETISHIYDGIKTKELDEYAAKVAAGWGTIHPSYLKYAAIIAVDNLHKETLNSFYETMHKVNTNKLFLREDFINAVEMYKDKLENAIDYNRDYSFDFIGFQTLSKSYLLRDKQGKICERPQHLYMRVALSIHLDNIDEAINTYNYLSQGYYTHATPTMFNAGTCNQQLASCFLLGTEDSIVGIYKTLGDCALISKGAGGIGIHIHNIRGSGSVIKSTNGRSNGITPMIQVFNATARYVDQGGGKRNGSIAMYLEPWHCDIFEFIQLRYNQGDEHMKARDMFLALWVPDLFMERVKNDELWSLMCPSESPNLSEVYGEEFNTLYTKYEKENKFRRQIPARELFEKIMDMQIETGSPYMCYKDSVNRKTNHSNLGIIKSSNLCSEIMEYSSSDEYAVCNLASISLTKFVLNDNTFDFETLRKVASIATKNLDIVIDISTYPTPETLKSNSNHRPIGLGVQGLADVFYKLKMPFESDEAKQLNTKIFETIYYGSVSASIELAEKKGCYSTFEGSPFSKGLLQFDLWDSNKNLMYDWSDIKKKIRHGIRNSLLTTVMPTASTSQILGNYECIEPPNSNIYNRTTNAGKFLVINKYLVDDLVKLGLWNEAMKDKIIYFEGSIQNIDEIPQNVKNLYKTVWEISQKALIDLSIGRGPFIDQSQSLNLFIAKPDHKKLFNCHLYGWKNGLKTGMYYLRTRAGTEPVKIGLGTQFVEQECTVCSS